MSTLLAKPQLVLGPESAGMLLEPEEFDAVEEYDEDYSYELIHGVLVVNPIPLAEETGLNEILGYYLLLYRHSHPQGRALDDTLPQQYVRTRTGRRLADRLIWTGLGRLAKPRRDTPSIAVEFVSAGRRNRRRDYVDKAGEYQEARLQENWIIDRFTRTMTVLRFRGKRTHKRVIKEHESYQSPLLPGFVMPLAEILEAADRRAQTR